MYLTSLLAIGARQEKLEVFGKEIVIPFTCRDVVRVFVLHTDAMNAEGRARGLKMVPYVKYTRGTGERLV